MRIGRAARRKLPSPACIFLYVAPGAARRGEIVYLSAPHERRKSPSSVGASERLAVDALAFLRLLLVGSDADRFETAKVADAMILAVLDRASDCLIRDLFLHTVILSER